jgi:hypothetical protein
MLGIVLPVVAAGTATSWLSRNTIPTVYIRVAIEIVVYVNVHIVVTPTAAVAPSAAPGRSHR